MVTYLVQTVNNMYQNVSGKSIENQELILRFFLLWVRCTTFQMEGTDFNKNIVIFKEMKRKRKGYCCLCNHAVRYARDNHIEGLETNPVRHTFTLELLGRCYLALNRTFDVLLEGTDE